LVRGRDAEVPATAAKEMVIGAAKIIKWVEGFLPPDDQRPMLRSRFQLSMGLGFRTEGGEQVFLGLGL
jgi:hypothetical protein